MDGFLLVEGLGKRYAGAPVKALDNISFNLPAGQVLAVVGLSGSGKSTLLKVIAGFEAYDEGSVKLAGQLLRGPNYQLVPGHKGVALVDQAYQLAYKQTVAEQLAYPLRFMGQAERQAQTGQLLEIIGLSHKALAMPTALSGGERQRVAIAVALAAKPRLLLLDEPFSSLDENTRASFKQLVYALVQQTGTTVILVTHHSQEALSMGSYMAAMRQGALVQFGTPQQLYNAPANLYVAELFGTFNRFKPADIEGGLPQATGSSQHSLLGIRPEHLHLAYYDAPGMPVTVSQVYFMGSYDQLLVTGSTGKQWWVNSTPPGKWQQGQVGSLQLQHQHVVTLE